MGDISGHERATMNQRCRSNDQIRIMIREAEPASIIPKERGLVEDSLVDRKNNRILTKVIKSLKTGGGVSPQVPAPDFVPSDG